MRKCKDDSRVARLSAWGMAEEEEMFTKQKYGTRTGLEGTCRFGECMDIQVVSKWDLTSH